MENVLAGMQVCGYMGVAAAVCVCVSSGVCALRVSLSSYSGLLSYCTPFLVTLHRFSPTEL